MEKGFEILTEITDVRMRVWGKTIKELFGNALAGVAFYLIPDTETLTRGGRKIKETIRVEAPDLNSLMIEFLSEVVARSDIHDVVFNAMTFKEFGENFLEGELIGVHTAGFEKDIKAVAYDEVDIKKNPDTGFFETVLVFDV